MPAQTSPRRRRFRWRTCLIGLLLLLLVGGAGAVFVARGMLVRDPTLAEVPLTQIVPVERRDLSGGVTIQGVLEPRERIRVGFLAEQRVSEVLVRKGERVTAGQILARLEVHGLQLKVDSSQAEVDQAEQALNVLLKGSGEGERAKAAAMVAQAQAALLAEQRAVLPIEVEHAQATLDEARQRLGELEQGVPTSEIREAEKQLRAAQDSLAQQHESLEKTRDDASRVKQRSQQAMEQATRDLTSAQEHYSDAYWDWDYVQRTGRDPDKTVVDEESGREIHPELTPAEIEAYQIKLKEAEEAVHKAEVNLHNAQEDYDQARKDEVRSVQAGERELAAAEQALLEAELALDEVRTRGTAQQIAQARKEVVEAEKAYLELADNPERLAKRAELEAALIEAREAQEKLAAGPDPARVAEARTNLEQARANLATAEANLNAATLRAPISGTVVTISLKPGAITTGEEAIEIADLNGFLIRGTVTEQYVTSIVVGQTAAVTVDAVPNTSFEGEVTLVSELPEQDDSSSGYVDSSGVGRAGLYPVEILIDADDRRLRVGMGITANIAFFTLKNVLVIPLQAVTYDEQGALVQRATGTTGPDGAPLSEPVYVELGRRNDDSVEVLSGLGEGDNLILLELPPLEDTAEPGQ